jgi:hypothetical protein
LRYHPPYQAWIEKKKGLEWQAAGNEGELKLQHEVIIIFVERSILISGENILSLAKQLF